MGSQTDGTNHRTAELARETGRRPRATGQTLTELPFVRDLPKDRRLPDGRARTFWAPECDGLDHPAREALGARYALKAARYMAEENLAIRLFEANT